MKFKKSSLFVLLIIMISVLVSRIILGNITCDIKFMGSSYASSKYLKANIDKIYIIVGSSDLPTLRIAKMIAKKIDIPCEVIPFSKLPINTKSNELAYLLIGDKYANSSIDDNRCCFMLKSLFNNNSFEKTNMNMVVFASKKINYLTCNALADKMVAVIPNSEELRNDSGIKFPKVDKYNPPKFIAKSDELKKLRLLNHEYIDNNVVSSNYIFEVSNYEDDMKALAKMFNPYDMELRKSLIQYGMINFRTKNKFCPSADILLSFSNLIGVDDSLENKWMTYKYIIFSIDFDNHKIEHFKRYKEVYPEIFVLFNSMHSIKNQNEVYNLVNNFFKQEDLPISYRLNVLYNIKRDKRLKDIYDRELKKLTTVKLSLNDKRKYFEDIYRLIKKNNELVEIFTENHKDIMYKIDFSNEKVNSTHIKKLKIPLNDIYNYYLALEISISKDSSKRQLIPLFCNKIGNKYYINSNFGSSLINNNLTDYKNEIFKNSINMMSNGACNRSYGFRKKSDINVMRDHDLSDIIVFSQLSSMKTNLEIEVVGTVMNDSVIALHELIQKKSYVANKNVIAEIKNNLKKLQNDEKFISTLEDLKNEKVLIKDYIKELKITNEPNAKGIISQKFKVPMNDLKKIDFLAEFDFYGKKIIFPVGINSIIDNSFKCYFFDCFERRKSKEFLSSSYRFNDIYKRYEHFSSSTGPVVINKKDIVTIIYIVDLKNQEIILEFYCKQ